MDSELIFIVEESDEGGYLARAIGESIFTEADSAIELKQNIIDAVKCHFGESDELRVIRLHYVKDELLAI